MAKLNIGRYFAGLFMLSLVSAGCGSGRELRSVAITPQVADARNFPAGQVSFSAVGTFSQAPSPVPLTTSDITWCAGSATGKCAGNINTGVTVDQNGLAQCGAGFTGTVTILAGSGGSVANPDGGVQLKTFGTAQLSCP